MESLFKQLRDLPARFQTLPAGVRAALVAGVGLAAVVALSVGFLAKGGEYQYAFTNLTQEDSTEAAGLLKNAGVPFRLEASGSALAVPADKVYDARIILATAGLPRGAGVGFELFDRGDLGVSEFTQKVNLRRATEGELARTIGNFAGVRSARVSVSLSERGLYREEDKKPSASVVAMLQPGRTLGERELAGIRHLVSSAVPGLPPDAVTVMDGHGAVLSADTAWDSPEASYQRKLEREFEQRIVSLLEPVVGAGAVIARVTASVDSSVLNQNTETFDPDQVALRSERKLSGNASNQSTQQQVGVAGAQANVPLQPPGAGAGATNTGTSANNDEVRNFEISKTVTQTVAHLPRLQKLSVAVVLDGVGGKPRPTEEITRLGELARKAVGYDETRGDQFEMTSQVFGRSPEVAEVKAPEKTPLWVWVAAGGAVLSLLAGAMVFGRRRKPQVPELVLQPGATVASLEAKASGSVLEGTTGEPGSLPEAPKPPLLVDPIAEVRERARALVRADPGRAVYLVRAWLSQDLEKGADHV
jgi:flagellar M-ring protein FliF